MTPARMARRGWRGSPLLLLPQWGLALTLLLACSFSETTGSRTEESSSGGGPGAPGADTGTRTCSAGGGAEPSDNVLCSPGTESEPLTVHCAQNGACKTRSHGGGGEGGEGNPREDDDSGRRGKAGGGGEVIKERLVVRQLRDGTHALVSMQQRTSTRLPRGASSPISTSLFPAFLLRLVTELRVERLSLTFSTGRWDYGTWGWASPGHTPQPKPAGVELWAAFGVPTDQADEHWEYLTRLLSGYFCAAIASLASSGATASPRWHLQPPDWSPAQARAAEEGSPVAHRRHTLGRGNNSSSSSSSGGGSCRGGSCCAPCTGTPASSLRYAQLPQDLMCTENLEPWLRLLPCRGLAGPFAALNKTRLYAAPFQTLRLEMHTHRTPGPAPPQACNSEASACASHTAADGQRGTGAGAGRGAEGAGGSVHLLQEVAYVHRPSRGVLEGSQPYHGGMLGGGRLGESGTEGGGGGAARPAWQAPPSWTVRGVLERVVPPACPVATSSQLAVELDAGLFPEPPSGRGSAHTTGPPREQGEAGEGGAGKRGGGGKKTVPCSCRCCSSSFRDNKGGNGSAPESSPPPLPLPRPWAQHPESVVQVSPPAWNSATWTTPALTQDQVWGEGESLICQAGTGCQVGGGESQGPREGTRQWAECFQGEEGGDRGCCPCVQGALSLSFELLPQAQGGAPTGGEAEPSREGEELLSDVSVSWGSGRPPRNEPLDSTTTQGAGGVPPAPAPLLVRQGLHHGTPSVGFSVEMYLLGGGNGGWQATLALELQRRVSTPLYSDSDGDVYSDESLREAVHRGKPSGGTGPLAPAGAEDPSGSDCLDVSVLQVLPWWVRPRYHTLELSLDGVRYTGSDLRPPLVRLGLQPGTEKKAPAVLELVVCAPPNAAHLLLTMQMDKVFLTVFDFPPDASRGLDMPPALVSISQCSWSHGAPSCSPPEHAYTSSVVLPMPEPDLSMPYNVITLTCTLLAMIIGSLLNVLRYRIEDRA